MDIKLLAIISGLVTNVAAQLCLRKGVMKLNINLFSYSSLLEIASSLYVWAGLILYSLSFMIYIYILSKFEVSYIYPVIMSAGIILLLIFSVLFINESLTLQKIIGIIVISAGIFIVTYQ